MSYSLEDFYVAADQQKDHSPFCTVVKGWGYNRYFILEGWWGYKGWTDRLVDFTPHRTKRSAIASAKNWAKLNDLKFIQLER